VEFSSPPPVSAGSQYAIVLSAATGIYAVAVDTGSGYAGGVQVASTFGGSWSAPYLDDQDFRTFVGAALATAAPEPARAGYCSVPGNTWPDGSGIAPGTFLNLDAGQPSTDANYKGATIASYVKDKGITCDAPPAGYTQQGLYDGPETANDLYPYYAPAA
jgi:hypothetical protein